MLTLAAVTFVILGLWMGGAPGTTLFSSRHPDFLTVVIGWFGIPFFGACGVVAVKRLFDASEQLRIGSSGIRWMSWSDQTIPGSETLI